MSLAQGWRVICEERVVGGQLASVGVHPARPLSRLDVAPDQWGHVSLVVHKVGVKIRDLVRIGGRDVSGATRKGVLEEMELTKIFSRWNIHVVNKEASENQNNA